jgi:Fe2+ or Zn2+ uptake regulation protein
VTERDIIELLRAHGIQPSPQRVAVGRYVLTTDEHPSAEQVFARVRGEQPLLSRATVYNTLNLLVEKGLLRQLNLAEGRVVFDANTRPHHHFIDDQSGHIWDVPWDALEVRNIAGLSDHGFAVRDYQVLMRGRKE